jgi:hypothetical protein
MSSITTDAGAEGGGGRPSAPVIIDDVQKALTGWDAHLEDPMFRALGEGWGEGQGQGQGQGQGWGQSQGQGEG